MVQEIELQLRTLRAELTQLVRDGMEDDGLLLRRLLAELERLEQQRWELRHSARPDRGPPVSVRTAVLWPSCQVFLLVKHS